MRHSMYTLPTTSKQVLLPPDSVYISQHLTSVEGRIKKCRRQDKCGEISETPDMKMIL